MLAPRMNQTSQWKCQVEKTTGFWRPGWLGRVGRRLSQEAVFRNYVAKRQVHGVQAVCPWVYHQMTSERRPFPAPSQCWASGT